MYGTHYDDFIQEYLNFFDEKESREKESVADRKDFCYDCNSDGYWVMMALRCEKCNKLLIGG